MKLVIQPARVRRRAVALAAAASAAAVGLAALAGPAAAATSVQIDDGTLQIKGDAAGNKLALVNQPAAFALDLGADGTPEFTIDRAAFTAVEIAAGNGDDEVTVVNGGGASDKPITIDGGAGNDTLRGSAASETLIGGSGDDVVDGNLGADVARLGSGDDHFQWDPGDASDTVEGQGGADVLDFNASNASEIVDIAADGSRVRLTRNIGSVTLDLDALEQVRLRALAGTDQITVGDLAGTGLRLADIDLGSSTGDGDNAADTVVAVGTDGPDRFASATRPARCSSTAALPTCRCPAATCRTGSASRRWARPTRSRAPSGSQVPRASRSTAATAPTARSPRARPPTTRSPSSPTAALSPSPHRAPGS